MALLFWKPTNISYFCRAAGDVTVRLSLLYGILAALAHHNTDAQE